MRSLAVLVGAAAACLVTPVSAQDFPTLGGRVTDQAGVLSEGFEQSLAARLEGLELRTSVSIVVLTVATLEGDSPDEFADSMLDQWREATLAGRSSAIMLLVPNDRTFTLQVRMPIEAEDYQGRPDAYWFEKGTVPPSYVKRLEQIMEPAVVPGFKEGDWQRGLSEGLDAVERALRRPETPEGMTEGRDET